MTEDAPEPSSSLPPRRRLPVVAIVVCAALAMAAGTAWWAWINRDALLAKVIVPLDQPSPPTAAPPLAVSSELDQIKARLQRLEAQAVEPKPQVDIAALEDRVARLEKNGADAASVLRLVDRIDRAEAALRDLQTRRKADAALVLAVGLLKDAVDRGGSFDTELRGLKALAPEDDDVKKTVADLKGSAAAGIPSRATLAARFRAIEAAVVRADALPSSGDGGVDAWKRRALERLMTLFTLRREDGDVEGNSTAAIVARAAEALSRNDWTGAVHHLEALTGESAKAAQSWLDDARARLTADRDIGDLAAQAVAAAGTKL